MAGEVEAGDVKARGFIIIGSAKLADAVEWELVDEGRRVLERLAPIIHWRRTDQKRWFPCGHQHQYAAGHSDSLFQRHVPAKAFQISTVIGAQQQAIANKTHAQFFTHR